MKGKSIAELVKEFKANEANRKYQYKGSNAAYHIILSFHPSDTEKINPEILHDLTMKFFELRAQYGMGLATYHEDRDHRHIHIILGNTEIASGKSLRMSRDEFRICKKQLQEYQQMKYPELVSLPDHSKRNDHQMSEAEFQVKRKTGTSRKDEIKESLQTAFDKSVSSNEFYSNIQSLGLNLYERSGKVAGIADKKRHFRFSTLGFSDKMQELETRNERMEQLENIREGGDIAHEPTMEIEIKQEDMQDVDVQDVPETGEEPIIN